jgi:hypothetical protein
MNQVPLVAGFMCEQPPPLQETSSVLLSALAVYAKDLCKTLAQIGVSVHMAPCRFMHSQITFCFLWQSLSVQEYLFAS